jgi:hypothetical protein
VSDVSVAIDNRVRLAAAVLAASHWPEVEQAQDPHAVHTHAKMTRQYVSDFAAHPATNTINALLESGRLNFKELFSAVLRSSWPHLEPTESLPDAYADGEFLEQLADFYTDSAVAAFFWSDHQAVWQEAAEDLEKIFEKSRLAVFLGKLLGRPPAGDIVVIPNLSYPTVQVIAARSNDCLHLILPPPRAYGESPPWPYGEDPGWVVAQSCYALTEILLAEVLQPMNNKQQELLRQAAVVLCLEETVSQEESLSYLVRSKKQYNLPELPETVEKMRAYLEKSNTDSLSDLV